MIDDDVAHHHPLQKNRVQVGLFEALRSKGANGFMALGQEVAAKFKLLRIFSVR